MKIKKGSIEEKRNELNDSHLRRRNIVLPPVTIISKFDFFNTLKK
jgi:hypothetical protein